MSRPCRDIFQHFSRGTAGCQPLEHGHHGAGPGLLHEGLDLVGLEGGHQSLDGGVVLPALLDGQHVHIGLGGLAVGGLDSQGVGGVQTGLKGVVAVDDGQVQAVQGAGQLGGLQLLDLQVLGVLSDVQLGGGQAYALLQGDEALLLEQEQGAALVGGVVGHAHLGAVGQM